ncbi:Cation/H+ exchanger [Powellomyces hirtus]|nr:Cation/H+ exchanger [Powellomyces hirtus]
MSIFGGDNPLKDATALFLLQLLLILGGGALLAVPLGRLRLPKVISEILFGVVLGPTCLGGIDSFRENVFPPESLSYLNATAWTGVSLYIFLVGLSIDLPSMIRKLPQYSATALLLSVGTAAFCAGPVYLLFNRLVAPVLPEVSYASYALFMSVVVHTVAFPVLARLLSEIGIMYTPLGEFAIGVAAVDDVLLWVLSAAANSLANPSASKLDSLYVLLCTPALILVLYFVFRPLMMWLTAQTSRSGWARDNYLMVTLCLVLVVGCSAQIVGVNYVFGAFLAGLVLPHDSPASAKLRTSLEGVSTILMLPVFFATSGLKTNFRLMATGEIWALSVLMIVAATMGKTFFGLVSSKIAHLSVQDGLRLGLLMNSRGIVQIVVLNLALNANVITSTIFVIMVFLILMTTVLTSILLTSNTFRVGDPATAEMHEKIETA